MVHLQPAIWARKQASLASFMAWAYAQELVESNPMGRVERMKPVPPAPRGVGRTLVEAILTVGAAGATLTPDNTASSLFRFSIPLLVTAQLRQTQSGKAVCNFVIAVNRFDGSTKKVEVSAWNALAAPAHDHLRKGREVLDAGVIESRHYTDRQGNIVDTLKLTAQVVKFLGSRRDDKARLDAEGMRRLGWRFQRFRFECFLSTTKQFFRTFGEGIGLNPLTPQQLP
jgi:hypothetical protein